MKLLSYRLDRAVSIIALGSIVALLGLFLHAKTPILESTHDLPGSGVVIDLPLNTQIIQPITTYDTPPTSLMVILSDTDQAHTLQAAIRKPGVGGDIPLGLSRPIVNKFDDKVLQGAIWQLPKTLSPNTPYTVVISIASARSESVSFIADERSTSNGTALSLATSESTTVMPASISLILGSATPRWEILSAKEKETYKRTAFSIIIASFGAIVATVMLRSTRENFIQPKAFAAITVVILVVAGLAIRIWTASHLPLVNDEQFYTYDALLYRVNDPQFWKTPILITALRAWTSLAGTDSLLQLRGLVIGSATAALLLLSLIAARIAGKLAGWSTLLLGLLLPTVAAYSSLVMTEHFMLLPIIGSAFLALKYSNTSRTPPRILLCISLLLAIAAGTRWSAIFWLPGILLLLRTKNKKEMLRRIFWVLVPFVAVGILFLATFPEILQKFKIVDIFVEFFENSSQTGWITKFAAWREPFGRFALLSLPTLLAFGGKTFRRRIIYILLCAIFIISFFPVWSASEIFPSYPFTRLLFFIPALLFFISGIFVQYGYNRTTIINLIAFIIPPIVAYAIFHKINDKYLAEFIPGIVLAAGLGTGLLLRSLRLRSAIGPAISLLMLLWLLLPWVYYPISRPYAGTISQEGVRGVVDYLQTHTSPDDRILTGSVLLPIMAERQPAFPISHPSWLEPTLRGQPDPRYYELFDPIEAEIRARKIPWVVVGKLTNDTYLRHPGISAAISELYNEEAKIDNDAFQDFIILRLQQ